ncbi:MAG: toll/interleukin-1 receptor domain-containing protein [Acidobacteriia bacterium]|nr:toll/interleukin-1 receptor domain-containing protein [Terriglobia bacterium]
MPNVFISYVSEDRDKVLQLAGALKQADVAVWLDRTSLKPGHRWKDTIRQAINEGDFFIACFSQAYSARERTYMNEELTLAIEELRQRPTDRAWFIPLLLSNCELPDRSIGAGETLRSLQWVSLHEDWDEGIRRLLSVIVPDRQLEVLPPANYLSGLDPWGQATAAKVAEILKLGALTSRRLVISDNQALNNSGFQDLLGHPEAWEFVSGTGSDGLPPVVISLRNGATNFTDVLQRLITDRERPAIMPWMTPSQQEDLEKAYSRKGTGGLGPFYDIAGPAFAAHVDRLDRYVSKHRQTLPHWNDLEDQYPSLVREAIDQFLRLLSAESSSGKAADSVKAACELLAKTTDQHINANRSNLFRVLRRCALDAPLERTLEIKLLHQPYHLNFARAGAFNLINTSESGAGGLGSVVPNVVQQMREISIQDTFELDNFPLLLSEIPFSRIERIRSTHSFAGLVETATSRDSEHKFSAVRDLVSLIHSELARESNTQHCTRLRLCSFWIPDSFRARFMKDSLCLADVVALGAGFGGMLLGQFVGESAGWSAVGTFAGAGIVVLLQQLHSASHEAKAREEFKQVIQSLRVGGFEEGTP